MQLFSNNSKSTLASGINAAVTSLTVATGEGARFPALAGTDFYVATLTNAAESACEIVKVTARAGDTMTIVRGQEGTSAAAWSAGDKVELRWTAEAAANAVASGPGYKSGKRYFHLGFVGGNNTLALTASRVYYVPFWVRRKTTFAKIGFDLTTLGAAGKYAKIGVYKAGDDGLPLTKLYESGDIDVGSGSTFVDKTYSASLALDAGLHYLAIISDGTPSVSANTPTSAALALFLGNEGAANSVNFVNTHFYEAGSGRTLPSAATPTGNGSSAAVPTLFLDA